MRTLGALIWKDPSVQMFLHFEYPRGRYWFSSARWQAKSIWLTLQGPGRIAGTGTHRGNRQHLTVVVRRTLYIV